MSKTVLIIRREYLTRVKKKSFIIMTIIGPLLMAALIIIPVWLTTIDDKEQRTVAVINQYNEFDSTFENTNSIDFVFLNRTDLDSIQKKFSDLNYYAVLYRENGEPYSPDGIYLSSDRQISLDVKMHISNAIEHQIAKRRIAEADIDPEKLEAIETDVDITTTKWDEHGKAEQTSTEITMAIGFICAFLIYMFVFIYGAQVMRGVIEEKTGRVVELIVSSVRPFQLMMGKIVGIALVALTQFVLWLVLTSAIVFTVQITVIGNISTKQSITESMVPKNPSLQQFESIQQTEQNEMINDLIVSIQNIPFFLIISSFVFYFIGGYLLYAAFFAAIGAAVDNESDTQQFMLPITIPLILAFVMAQNVIQNPDGAISFWFSVIPFTSPIIMMIRIAFGVPTWQIALSMFLLVITFIGATWLAGKIYRTGILMYGKKVTYKELWKWLKYGN